jgi:hypothetical protein
MTINSATDHGFTPPPSKPVPTVTFECVILPDGTKKGRHMSRAVLGNAYAAFYPIGRKGQFWVTWGTMDDSRSGGEAVDGRPTAEFRATEILRSLNK